MSVTASPTRTVADWWNQPATNLTVRMFSVPVHHTQPLETPEAIAKPMNHIFRRAPLPRTDRLAAVKLCHAVSRAVFEILAGYRSIHQLAFALDTNCIEKLKRQALVESRCYTQSPEPGTSHGCVRSLRMEQTSSGAYECAAVISFKYRVRAVALRIEPWHGRWQVTELEVL